MSQRSCSMTDTTTGIDFVFLIHCRSSRRNPHGNVGCVPVLHCEFSLKTQDHTNRTIDRVVTKPVVATYNGS